MPRRPDQYYVPPYSPAVAPGSSQVVIGQVVIIYGAAGGLFLYQGTPGLGNPPIFYITTASTDPFGNPVNANTSTNVGIPVLMYNNTTPALGNLLASDSPSDTTDGPGNAVLAGRSVYVNSTPAVALNMSLGVLTWYTAPNSAGPWTNVGSIGQTSTVGGTRFQSDTAITFETPSALGAEILIFPSGDTTGATDSANIAAAFSAGILYVRLGPGTYTFDSTVDLDVGEALIGPGQGLCTVQAASGFAGPLVKLVNTQATNVAVIGSTLAGITFDGTNGSAACVGVYGGDIIQMMVWDVAVNNFAGAGAHFINATYEMENGYIRMFSQGCTTPFILDGSGAGTNSFDRTQFDLTINQFNADGNGVLMQGGAVLQGGMMRIAGNFAATTAANTGIVLGLAASCQILSARLDIAVECDSSGGAVNGPQTMNFASGSQISGCYGVAQFVSGTGVFAASNNNGEFSLTGSISGDATLERLTQNLYHSVTTGFPTGWTGSVLVEKVPVADVVLIKLELTVASGTVMTNGETICTLPSPYYSFTGNYFTIPLLFGHANVAFQVDSSGNLKYEGATQTPSGAVYPQGSAVYSSGH